MFASTVGCYRLAFEAVNVREFYEVHTRTREAGIELLQAVDYEVSWAFTFYDPDENEVEIFLDRRGKEGGQLAFRGLVRSLNPARLRNEAMGAPEVLEERNEERERIQQMIQTRILSRHGYKS
jgi:catechol-2,3-dioxygenase